MTEEEFLMHITELEFRKYYPKREKVLFLVLAQMVFYGIPIFEEFLDIKDRAKLALYGAPLDPLKRVSIEEAVLFLLMVHFVESENAP